MFSARSGTKLGSARNNPAGQKGEYEKDFLTMYINHLPLIKKKDCSVNLEFFLSACSFMAGPKL